VAVFPDRIVLKNSTDSQAAIEAAIESGGTDEIAQGEIVLGLASGTAQIYTRDAVGSIVTISGGSAGEGGGGRGDGGDFDTGTVDITFAFGVYGGGDFDTGTNDNPIEITGGDEGPDAGSF
jgi:hypothetical protein